MTIISSRDAGSTTSSGNASATPFLSATSADVESSSRLRLMMFSRPMARMSISEPLAIP